MNRRTTTALTQRTRGGGKTKRTSHLVSLQQGLGAGDILSQFVRRHQSHHAVDPRSQIAVVRQEALKVVGIEQLALTSVSLKQRQKDQNDPSPAHNTGIILKES